MLPLVIDVLKRWPVVRDKMKGHATGAARKPISWKIPQQAKTVAITAARKVTAQKCALSVRISDGTPKLNLCSLHAAPARLIFCAKLHG